MKVSGFFRHGPFEAAYVRARLRVPKLRIDRQVELLIDTGASRTIISDRDALWLGIDRGKLEKTDASIGIGGSVDTYVIPDVTFTFATVDGQSYEFKLQRIFAIEHKKIDARVWRIPSILGRDFLNQFTLIYSRRKESVVITDENPVSL